VAEIRWVNIFYPFSELTPDIPDEENIRSENFFDLSAEINTRERD